MLRRVLTISCLLAVLAPALARADVGTPPPAAAPPNAHDLALALKLRPRLLFDAKERWRPTDVDRFLAEPGEAACPPRGRGACAPLSGVAQLTPLVAYLDLRGTHADGSDATSPDIATCAKTLPILRECDKGGRSVIYAHVVHRGARIAIDYWWFLRYNAYSLDRHEGDWEGVTVVVDRAGRKVLDVDFAAHSDVWRYERSVPRVVGGRVKVYVALGDHAAYPRRCTFACRQTGGALPDGRSNGARSWIGNSAAGCRRRCVKLFPQTADGAPASWNAWNGRWGVPSAPAFLPPLTPADQRRFKHPFQAKHTSRHVFIAY